MEKNCPKSEGNCSFYDNLKKIGIAKPYQVTNKIEYLEKMYTRLFYVHHHYNTIKSEL